MYGGTHLKSINIHNSDKFAISQIILKGLKSVCKVHEDKHKTISNRIYLLPINFIGWSLNPFSICGDSTHPVDWIYPKNLQASVSLVLAKTRYFYYSLTIRDTHNRLTKYNF